MKIELLPIVIILVLILIIIGVVYWAYLTKKGRAFIKNYAKQQQNYARQQQLKKDVEDKISSIANNHLAKRNIAYTKLITNFQQLSTFQQVQQWDELAEAEINNITDSYQIIKAEISKYKNDFNTLIINEQQWRQTIALEDMASKLQDCIDFTPNSLKEKKKLLKELRQQKKELQLQKREIIANMKAIQSSARTRSTYAGRGFFGIGYSSKLAASERRSIRYQKESLLRPHEDDKAAIERQILQIDKDILWVERFSN